MSLRVLPLHKQTDGTSSGLDVHLLVSAIESSSELEGGENLNLIHLEHFLATLRPGYEFWFCLLIFIH